MINTVFAARSPTSAEHNFRLDQNFSVLLKFEDFPFGLLKFLWKIDSIHEDLALFPLIFGQNVKNSPLNLVVVTITYLKGIWQSFMAGHVLLVTQLPPALSSISWLRLNKFSVVSLHSLFSGTRTRMWRCGPLGRRSVSDEPRWWSSSSVFVLSFFSELKISGAGGGA